MGIGQALTYSICYLDFSIPFMMKTAIYDYEYKNDDILNDVISSFGVMACSAGEIIGPLYSGLFSHIFGIGGCCVIASGLSFFLVFVFVFGTGLVSGFRKKSDLLISMDTVEHSDSS